MKKILIVDDVQGWRNYHSQIVNELFANCEIITASSATEGYNKLMENNNSPFDIIITDLQMENDYEPKLAGEWLVEQIKTFKNYLKTKIIIVSASYNISFIADNFGVEYIRKSTAIKFPDSYKILED
ncbi:MAG: response regulator [bacterium]|nr:response regulator [bacterium]